MGTDIFNEQTFGDVVPEIKAHGVTVVRDMIAAHTMSSMHHEMKGLHWRTAPRVIGERQVRQEYSFVKSFPASSIFCKAAIRLEALLNSELSRISPCPTTEPIHFNNMRLQRYAKGSLGIEPHRDGSLSRYVIALFVIRSGGTFYTCADASKAVSVPIKTEPGDLILMRGVDFCGSREQPWHYVDRVDSERITFGMRHMTC